MNYVPLHAHDTYGSIGDSILYIKDYVQKAKELGIKSLAITNHGSLSTFVEFYETCIENDIKPIIGCEFYYVKDISIRDKNEKRNHLILLAKNNKGLHNLIQLHNEATDKGFYYRPRIDFDLLTKYHDGIICLTACVAGHIPRLILSGQDKTADVEILKFKKLFQDDFYLEIQPGSFEEQKTVNAGLIRRAEEFHIPFVITNDIHYLNKDDWKIHDFHVKDARKMSLEDQLVYPDTCYYFMSYDELKEISIQTIIKAESIINTALANTVAIADKVNVTLSEEKFMPCFDKNIDEHQLVTTLCYNKLAILSSKLVDPSAYMSRLEYELDVIHTLGFDGYFLIVKDIVDFCDKNKIGRGPGRGSACGSLVAFLLNITKIDPIQYELMFERFLSKSRKSDPDIDLDILPERRDEVFEYITEKYGTDHCCFVSTFNKRKARAAIKTAARILNHSVQIGDMLSKAVPYVLYEDDEKHVDPSITEVIERVPSFAALAKQHKDIIDLAIQLQGYPSSMGIHPAGIVISPVPIIDRYPLVRCKDKILRATSLDLAHVEKLSGVKIDLLSLANLTTICAVLEESKEKIDLQNPYFFQDEDVWNLIGSANTTGLFQISSFTYQARMPQLKPKSIPELAACLALVRGPCISSGADKKYIRMLHGQDVPIHICKEFWNVTEKTFGIIIYQEQVLKVCQAFGMSEVDSYYLLKACSKKKADQLAKYHTLFSEAAAKNNISKEAEGKVWAEIMNSAKYAFNIAHATAYAVLCYISAWLKIHHPALYMCKLLNKIYAKPDPVQIQMAIRECDMLNLEFLPLDVNESQWNFVLVDNYKIRIGFIALKGLGEKAYEAINEVRPIVNFHDFLERVSGRQCNKRIVELLILSGAFGNEDSGELLEEYLTQIRKESMIDTLKIGRDIIQINVSKNAMEQQLFGSVFSRKDAA